MRAFGATIHMRDDDMSKEYEPRIPSKYHADELRKAKEKLLMAESLKDASIIKMRTKELNENKKYHIERIKESRIVKSRLEDFLHKAMEFNAPTPDHQGLKDFMVNQLRITIDGDGNSRYHEEKLSEIEIELKKIDANQVRLMLIQDATKDIAYHLKEHKEELVRCAKSNLWVKTLLTALDNFEQL
jgi:hypothetical protein